MACILQFHDTHSYNGKYVFYKFLARTTIAGLPKFSAKDICKTCECQACVIHENSDVQRDKQGKKGL